jgi:hypothetical protein
MLASQMTRRLFLSRTFEEAVDTIFDDVIALLGAEYGNVQLSIGEEWSLPRSAGFQLNFLENFWARQKRRRVCVRPGSAAWRPSDHSRRGKRYGIRRLPAGREESRVSLGPEYAADDGHCHR